MHWSSVPSKFSLTLWFQCAFVLSKREKTNYTWADILEMHVALGDLGSVALLPHNALKWSAILGLSFFLRGAGGQGNPCYGVQAYLVNFALHFQKC